MPLNKDTNIVWTDHTYNAWKGCAKRSEGCQNCWAETIMSRFGHTEQDWTVANTDENVTVYDEFASLALDTDPAWIFTPSASDPYLPWVPEDARRRWYRGLDANRQHVFQVLTKWGPESDVEYPLWPANVMLGVTVESPRRKPRIDWLREQRAAVKFISFEPLIEPIQDVDLEGIDWAIVGGESHPDADERRDMDPEWARRLFELCREQDVAFLFKQHSGRVAEADRTLNTWTEPPQTYTEFPDVPGDRPPAPQEFLE